MKPKVVLIGAGKFGSNHLRNLIELDKKKKLELIGVADADKKILSIINKKNGIPTSTNFRDFLNNADAFDVVTPASTHYDIVKFLLSKSKHVMVEKPLSLNSNQANYLVKLSKRKKKILQVGHIFRYNEVIDFLKKRIQNKDRHPFFISGKFIQTTKPKTDVGAIFNYLHHFDILDNILEKPPRSIIAVPNLFSKDKTRHEINAEIFLKYPKLNVNLLLGWVPNGKVRSLNLYSLKEYLKCDLEKQKVTIFNENGKIIKKQFKFKEPLHLELLDFIDCVIGKKKSPLANVEVGARVVKIAETAINSMNHKKEIKLRKL